MKEVEYYTQQNEANVFLTPSALQHVLTYLAKEGRKGVRLSVKKTGCSGLSYVVDYVETPSPTDKLLSLEGDYFVCIDKKSFPYLNGITVDYVQQGLNHKFVFHNPNQTGQCGCGESFTVE